MRKFLHCQRMILNVENKAKLVKLGPVWVTYLKQCMAISSLSSPRSRKLGHPLTLSFLPELFVPPHCQSPPVCCCFCLWGYQTDSLEEALGLGSARRRGDQSPILRNNGTELFLRHLLTRRSRDVCRSGLGTGLDEPVHIFNFLRSLVAGHLVCHHRFQTIVREKTEEKKFFLHLSPCGSRRRYLETH